MRFLTRGPSKRADTAETCLAESTIPFMCVVEKTGQHRLKTACRPLIWRSDCALCVARLINESN